MISEKVRPNGVEGLASLALYWVCACGSSFLAGTDAPRRAVYFLSALHATNMSVATNGNPSERSRCYKFFWRLFPHVFLILSLIAYAALGAVVFCKIEGGRDVSNQQAYQEFISKLMAKKNASGKSYYCTLNGLAYLSIYSGLSLDQT